MKTFLCIAALLALIGCGKAVTVERIDGPYLNLSDGTTVKLAVVAEDELAQCAVGMTVTIAPRGPRDTHGRRLAVVRCGSLDVGRAFTAPRAGHA